MTATDTPVYRLGEFHRFDAEGAQFLYLVPAGAIFAVDEAVGKLVDCLGSGRAPHEGLVEALAARGLEAGDAEELIAEMCHAKVIVGGDTTPETPPSPPDDFPVQTLVMNLTNQCNLSCQYCYEFGEDKVATPEGKPKFMDIATAKTSVDFLLAQSGDRRSVHITFFGGETLMNFPLLKQVVAYANEPGRGAGASHRLQSYDQRHTAHAGDHRVSFREPHRRYGEHGRAEGNARPAPCIRQRPRQLRHYRAESARI